MADRVTRRGPRSVPGRAVVVGLVAAAPVAMLVLLVPAFVGALFQGDGLAQAWRSAAMTDEDWEMVPVYLFCAVLIGAVIALAAAAVWLLLTTRLAVATGVARVGTAVVAAAVPLLLVGFLNAELAGLAAVPAALITYVAAPRVGRHPLIASA